MIEWILAQVDAVDVVVITLVLAGTAWFVVKSRGEGTSARSAPFAPKVVPVVPTTNGPLRDTSLLARMQAEGRQVLILYGSQTGTAEELAGRLAKDLQKYGRKALLLDPEEMNVDDFGRIAEVPNVLVVLCVATYGEGDPTDNAQYFYEYINGSDIQLSGSHFAVFGLGNKTYEHFNQMGKFFDARMEELGSTRIYELGLGDDDGNLEEDFMRWREGFWPAVAECFGWEMSEENGSHRQYRFEALEDPSVRLFTGEYARLGAFEKQRPPFDQKNPFMASIEVNRELHKPASERSCRHVEFVTTGARVRYEAGDHLGVFPTNDVAIVEELGKLLSANMDQAFSLINLDEESSKRNPFPCPCSFRTALTHYVDICAPVKSHVLKALIEFTTDEKEKEQLTLLSTTSDEGLKMYGTFVQKERRSIVDVLRHFSSCKPPVDYLLELLPRLQARYYSISSSPRVASDHIAITAIVTRYTIGERLIKGVCTNYLLHKQVNDKVAVFVRKSTMRLPGRATTPVIMVGPGTGFAPFRGFIQERQWHKQQGKEIGSMILFYGCRHPEHDYIYEDELKEFVAEGVITELHIAFSRLLDKKVYVQNKIWENRESLWKAIQGGAHIYVCGDARNMARDVQNMFLKIFVEVGGKTETEAKKFQKDLEKQKRYQADVWS